MGHVETIDRSPFPRCFVMSLFRWILSGSTKPSPGARSEPGIAGQPTAQAYPSVDPGLPNLPVDAILEQNQDLIARIKLAYGADRESFGKELLPLIRRYAEYVHLLPATADNYYCTPGGLFRLGIHVAFYSLQSTDSQIFSGQATILKRKHLEPRWRKATFVAGLCHEVHRTLSHLVVTDREGNEWPAYIHPLAKWLDQGRVNRKGMDVSWPFPLRNGSTRGGSIATTSSGYRSHPRCAALGSSRSPSSWTPLRSSIWPRAIRSSCRR